MPSPKNRLKLTGDTHLPDPRFDYVPDDDDSVEMLVVVEEHTLAPRVYADGYVPPSAEAASSPEPAAPSHGIKEAAMQKVGALEAKKPWLALGVALAFGWLVAKMLRR